MRRFSIHMRPIGRTLLSLALVAILAGCGSSVEERLQLEAHINGVNVDDGTRSDPIDLTPEDPVLLELTVKNDDTEAVQVRHIRLEGQVIEMRFAHANTAVDFSVEPGATRDFAVEIDFFDLGEQVTGQLDAVLSLHDDDRELLAARQFFVDVDGNSTSSLGATLLMLALFSAVSLAVNLLGVTRGTLPANRWYRGLRFAFTGFSVALLILLLLAFVGLWLAPLGVWIPILVIGTLGAFALGYISPGPDDEEDDAEDLAASRVA